MTDSTDMSDDHLYDLVIEWDNRRRMGEEVPPEELCRDEPELLEPLQVRIESVRRTDWLYESKETTDVGDFLTTPDIKKIVMAENTLPQSKLTMAEFALAITTSGLMASEAVQVVKRNTSAVDARDMAVALVSQGKLTYYQARVLLEGRKEPLILDRYVILERLDAGGMGQVFKALHRPMERVVALKMPPSAAVDSPEKVKRFQREVKAAARLSHPNVVTAHDACESAGIHFLVMELVDGKDLHKLVTADGPLPVAKAVDYVVQAAKGLEYAHSQGVIHRDIKPHNLILDRNGTIKVLDLGLARFESPTATEMTAQELTEAGIPMGTVAFMSPEQALDAKHADQRSDIYSLGCTLYFLLTGRPPYRENTPMKTLVAHRERAVPTLRAARHEVPETLDEVYCKMVAKRPEDRYQQMTEILAALEGCEIPKEEPDTGTAGACRTLLLAEVPLPETQTYLPEAKRAEKPQPKPRRWRLGVGVAVGVLLVGLVFAGIIFKIKTSGGTVVLECSQTEIDGAVVTVDGEEKITIKLDEKAEPITINLDQGRRKLEVVKGGFKTFTDEFEIGGGEKWPIKVYLERLPEEKKPAGKVAQATAPIDVAKRAVVPNSESLPPLAIAPFSANDARKHQERWAAHLNVSVEEVNSIGTKMILIPPGKFEMGSTSEQIAWAIDEGKRSTSGAWYTRNVSCEAPRHHVTITKSFYLGVCELTRAEYGKADSGTAGTITGDAQLPIDSVSWFDAVDFCNRLSRREGIRPYYIVDDKGVSVGGGNGYRLPTEAEWEYACRAGTTTKWSFGDDASIAGEHAWHKGNSGDNAHRVGEKRPNAWGLHDMHGNVSEWCGDWRRLFDTESQTDPIGGNRLLGGRAMRGGAFAVLAHEARSAFRFGPTPEYRNPTAGFRLARNCEGRQPHTTPHEPVDTPSAPVSPDRPAKPSGGAAVPSSSTPPPLAIAPYSADEARMHQGRWAAHLKVPVEETNSVGMKMHLIPPGRFEMGSTSEQIAWAMEEGKKNRMEQWFFDDVSSEKPRHGVDITKPFYLGVYEVTQADYEKVTGTNPSKFRGDLRQPVENVSWFDAVAFCNRISEREHKRPYYKIDRETVTVVGGCGYRLPTEAEWEYACRAGTTTKWNAGDDESMLGDYAWHRGNSDVTVHNVGDRKPNPWGLCDMHGNVSEWCWDFALQQYEAASAKDPMGLTEGRNRVLRGGAFLNQPRLLRSAFRISNDPRDRNSSLGFRVARNCTWGE